MVEQLSSKIEAGEFGCLDLCVQVPTTIVAQTYQKVLQNARRKVQVAGYRVGRAPLSSVRRRMGDYLQQMVAAQLIKDNADKAAQAHGLPPFGADPDVSLNELAAEDKPFEFRVRLHNLRARVTKLCSYDNLKLTDPSSLGDLDELADKKLRTFLCQHAESKERGDTEQVEENDRVTFSCTVIDDQQPQPVDLKNGQQQTIIIGVDDKLPSQVDRSLLGMRCGATRRIARIIKRTDGWHGDDLEGQKVTFNLTVHKVEQLLLPELNDALVQKLTGNISSVEALRRKLWQECKDEKSQEQYEWLCRKIERILLEQSEVEIPQQLIDKVADFILQRGEFEKPVEGTPEHDALRRQCYEQAKHHISLTAILEEIARRENITVQQKSSRSRFYDLQNAVMKRIISTSINDGIGQDDEEDNEGEDDKGSESLAKLRHDLIEKSELITLADYKQLAPNLEKITASKAEIERKLEELRRVKAAYLLSDAPITREKDLGVVVSMVLSLNGQPVSELSTMGTWIALPKHEKLDENLEKLVGMRAGERKTTPLPRDNSSSPAPEAKVEVTLIVHEVQELILPTVDDQFAQEFFDLEDVAALHTKIEHDIEQKKLAEQHQIVTEETYRKLIEDSEVQLDTAALEKIVTTVLTSKALRQLTGISEDLSEEDAARQVRDEHARATRQYLATCEVARREKLVDVDAASLDHVEVIDKVAEYFRKQVNIDVIAKNTQNEKTNVISVDDD